MYLTLITAPAEEPVTLAEAKKQLEITTTDDDTLITALLSAARMDVEAATKRRLITQTHEWRLDAFPDSDDCVIRLPLPPLQSVSSIKYIDADGAEQTWATSEYVVDAPAGPQAAAGTVRLAYGKTWPTTRDEINAVRIRFICGYGAAAAVPEGIKAAVKLKLTELHQHRDPEMVSKGQDGVRVDYNAKAGRDRYADLLAPYSLPEAA